MSATSQVAVDERSPSRWVMAIATLALMTIIAMPRPARGADLDVVTLKVRLRETSAIGLVTKIALKQDIERLIHGLADYHAGRTATPLATLHEMYSTLVTRTVGLLEHDETELARELTSSSDRLWTELSDPDRFAALAES